MRGGGEKRDGIIRRGEMNGEWEVMKVGTRERVKEVGWERERAKVWRRVGSDKGGVGKDEQKNVDEGGIGGRDKEGRNRGCNRVGG